jgi:hypothetical protein
MQIAATNMTNIADCFTPTAFLHRLLAGASPMVVASAKFDGSSSGHTLGYTPIVAFVSAMNGVPASTKPSYKSLVA